MNATNLKTHLAMSVFLLAMVLMLCAGMARGQVQEEWVARYNGPGNAVDWAYAIALDASGNVYVTGYSRGSGTGDDYATIKYDSAGNQLWVARYNGPGNARDIPYAIALDASGNVYVTGYCDNFGDFNTTDYATVKYDSAGNQLWAARYNGPGNDGDWSSAMALDASGSVYVTGESKGSGTDFDYATIKYDVNGNELWVRRYNGPANNWDRAEAIALDKSGSVYVTGYSQSGATIESRDYATIKYDTNGNELWVARYNGPGNNWDGSTAMALDASGNVYVTGYSPGSGTGRDYATIKYDTNGNQLWVRRYNGPGNDDDRAEAIALDASGNVYVTGYSQSGATIESRDYATIKYDTNGNELWVARYNGPGNNFDSSTAMALDASGNVYVTGYSQSGATIESRDYATIKYDTNGNELWVARYNGPGNNFDSSTAMALDASCNVYVTGESDGSVTELDYTTIKYSQDSQMGDLDCDNDVDLADFGFFAAHWPETDCGVCGRADFSGDGDVDLEDFAIFAAQWLAGVEN